MYYRDSAHLSKAYVAELAEFIDVAQQENKRILNKTNLLWIIDWLMEKFKYEAKTEWFLKFSSSL